MNLIDHTLLHFATTSSETLLTDSTHDDINFKITLKDSDLESQKTVHVHYKELLSNDIFRFSPTAQQPLVGQRLIIYRIFTITLR